MLAPTGEARVQIFPSENLQDNDSLERFVLALREMVFDGLDKPRERRRWQWEFDENPLRVPGVPDALYVKPFLHSVLDCN